MKVLCMSACLLVYPAHAAGQASDILRITIEDAVARAVAVSPLVRATGGLVVAADAERAEAALPFASDPTIAYSNTRRRRPTDQVTDYGWSFTQEVEIAGQSFVRRGAASRRRDAA